MLKEKFDLTGKIALVTGSTRGIGKAIGDALEEYGAKVIRHNTKVCDLSDPAAIEAFFAKLSNVWARVAPEAVLPNLLLDAHPLNNLRVNVNAQMFDPIYDKLGVVEGDAMYLAPNQRINIWGPNA